MRVLKEFHWRLPYGSLETRSSSTAPPPTFGESKQHCSERRVIVNTRLIHEKNALIIHESYNSHGLSFGKYTTASKDAFGGRKLPYLWCNMDLIISLK